MIYTPSPVAVILFITFVALVIGISIFFARQSKSSKGFFAAGGDLDGEWCEYFAGFDVVVSYLFDPQRGAFEAADVLLDEDPSVESAPVYKTTGVKDLEPWFGTYEDPGSGLCFGIDQKNGEAQIVIAGAAAKLVIAGSAPHLVLPGPAHQRGGARSTQHQTVDAFLDHALDHAEYVGAVGALDHHDVRVALARLLQDADQHRAEVGAVRVRIQQADADRVGAGQAARGLVGLVAEFTDRLLDRDAGAAAHAAVAVDDARDGHRRDAGPFRDVAGGDALVPAAPVVVIFRGHVVMSPCNDLPVAETTTPARGRRR